MKATFCVFKIKTDISFVAIGGEIVVGSLSNKRGAPSSCFIAIFRLNFDHIGTKIT